MKCKFYWNILIIIVISNKYSKSTTIKTIWSKAGQPITIPCDLSKPLNNNYRLEWKKNFQTIFTANGNENGHSIAAYQGRLARATDLSLTFHNVNRQDSATYQCGITKDEELSQLGTFVKLAVYSAPDILVPSKDQTFFVQDNFEINCEAKGQPKPHIIWTKDNQIISLNSVLKFVNFDKTNNGQYFCHATNPEGTVNQSAIILAAESPVITKNLNNITISEGNNVHWQCETKSVPNNVTFTWLKNGKEISSNYFDSKLHFYKDEFYFDFVQKDDSGWYTCRADNGFKPKAESSAFLNVLYRPKVVVEPRVNEYVLPFDGNITLICKTEGNPQIYSYQWTKNGQFLTTTFTKNLYLQHDSVKNGGIYTCQGFNLLGGGDVLEFVVTVSEPLKFLKKPPPFIYVDVGENVKIECTGYGYPPPVQYWLRNKTRLSSHILEIYNVSSTNGGLYQCILANGDNIAYQNVNFLVKNTVPQCPLDFQISCFGETGLNISFDPGFDGGYPQTFQIRSKMFLQAKNQIQNNKWIVENPKNNYFHLIDHNTPFSTIEIWLDAENIKGSTKCFLGNHEVCSKLSVPKSIKLNQKNELIWDQVENAEEYLVVAKIGKTDEFIQLAKTKDTKYALHHSINVSNPDLKIAVKALHKSYQNSDYGIFDQKQENERFPKILIIVVFLLLIFGVFIVYKYDFCFTKLSNQKTAINNEPKTMEDDYMSDFQRMASTNTPFSSSNETNATMERQFRHFTPDTERMSIVTDTFRKHYMDNPEYNKVNIIDELRLAQLKQELCASSVRSMPTKIF